MWPQPGFHSRELNLGPQPRCLNSFISEGGTKSQSLGILFGCLQLMEDLEQGVEQDHAEVGTAALIAELAEGSPIVTQFFYSSIIFGVKKKNQWGWVGFFAQNSMLLMKKRLLFSIFCCLFLLGKLETHNFCQRNISSCLSEFL